MYYIGAAIIAIGSFCTGKNLLQVNEKVNEVLEQRSPEETSYNCEQAYSPNLALCPATKSQKCN